MLWVLSLAFMGAPSHRSPAAASVELPTPLPVFDSLADPERGRLGPAPETKLGEDAGHVVLRSPGADHQAVGDLSVRAALSQEVEDLVFSPGQPLGSTRPRAAGRGTQLPQQRR